ncbi:tyrosine-type recombinase/integrase [Kitasatospora purpeofusca]|uniref:tyrosine-type recombinase/integrase n=1 Tax=Kitasatospora purpeofusca TaxID=67352 RepID=UPI00364C55D7
MSAVAAESVRDVSVLVVPRVGAVVETGDPVLPYRLIDGAGEEVAVVNAFLRNMRACDCSPLSLRSYGMDLLRWWRFLAAVDVRWHRAQLVEVRDFVLWMQQARKPTKRRPGSPAPGSVNPTTGKRYPSAGYAPRTINHALSVIREFYEFQIDEGAGPVRNPVPAARRVDGDRLYAHHNPMDPFHPHRRAPLRQKEPKQAPRSLPDTLFNDLFTAMPSNRDRAILAFAVSSGVRPSELLGVTQARINPGDQTIGVIRKGSRALQWVPASADAFVWLRLYQQELHDLRLGANAGLWWTRRRPYRPLTYHAMRAVLVRANAVLGTNWTLHDLRHTAAYRMAEDPKVSLTDVQWVLGHAQLTTTQIYLEARPDAVIERMRTHHAAAAVPHPVPPAPSAGGYRPEVLTALLGRPADVH